MVVYFTAAGLDDEDVFVSDGFADCYGCFLVGVFADDAFGEVEAEASEKINYY